MENVFFIKNIDIRVIFKQNIINFEGLGESLRICLSEIDDGLVKALKLDELLSFMN